VIIPTLFLYFLAILLSLHLATFLFYLFMSFFSGMRMSELRLINLPEQPTQMCVLLDGRYLNAIDSLPCYTEFML